MDATTSEPLTVGGVARRTGVTVRTLHHYDEIGLVVPGGRSLAGYRLYDEADLERLQQVVVYRRLGFPLDEIAALLDDPDVDVVGHLQRQRDAVRARLAEMTDLVAAIDRALEGHMSGIRLTPDEQRELFGDGYDEQLAAEAEQRWGDTDAYRESARRTAQYSKADWVAVKAEMDEAHGALAEAMRSGADPTSEVAMDAAEAHRRMMSERFYDVSHDMHRHLADMYVADERFTKTYDDIEPGLAQYVRDAVHANADRHARA